MRAAGYAHIKHNHIKHKAAKRTDHGYFWARNFVVCGACNKPLWVVSTREDKASANYRCKNCGFVKATVIHEMIDTWITGLTEMPKQDKVSPVLGQNFLGTMGLVDQWHNTARQMWETIVANNTQGEWTWASIWQIVCKHRGEQDGVAVHDASIMSVKMAYASKHYTEKSETAETDTLEVLYKQALANEPMQAKIAELDKDLDNLFSADWSSKEMQKRCDAKAKEIEKQKEELLASMVSLLPKYQESVQRLTLWRTKVMELQGDLRGATGLDKAVKLIPYLDELKLYFGESGYACKLVRAEIHTKDGLPGRVFDQSECRCLYEKQRLPRKVSAETRQSWCKGQQRRRHNEKAGIETKSR